MFTMTATLAIAIFSVLLFLTLTFSNELQLTFDGENSRVSGIMFTINAKQSVTINSLDIVLGSWNPNGSDFVAIYQIWSKAGDWNYKTSTSDWNRIHNFSIVNVDNYVEYPSGDFSTPIHISSGSSQSFHVVTDSSIADIVIDFPNESGNVAAGDEYFSDSFIGVTTGVRMTGVFQCDYFCDNVITWRGSVYYYPDYTEATRNPTAEPTIYPTKIPTIIPTNNPTSTPTKHPVVNPTPANTVTTTIDATQDLSKYPTRDLSTYTTQDLSTYPTPANAVTTNYEVKIDITTCQSTDNKVGNTSCDINPDALNEVIETLMVEDTTVEIVSTKIVNDDLVIHLSITTSPVNILKPEYITHHIEGQIQDNEDFGDVETEEKDENFNDITAKDTHPLITHEIMIALLMLICALCCIATLYFCYAKRKKKVQKQYAIKQIAELAKSVSLSSNVGLSRSDIGGMNTKENGVLQKKQTKFERSEKNQDHGNVDFGERIYAEKPVATSGHIVIAEDEFIVEGDDEEGLDEVGVVHDTPMNFGETPFI